MNDKSNPLPTEQIPSQENQISALGSANAPIAYFESVPYIGGAHGVGAFTLTMERQIAPRVDATGQHIGALSDHVVVAHLRGSMHAFRQLRDAINLLEQMELARLEKPAAPAEAPSILQ